MQVDLRPRWRDCSRYEQPVTATRAPATMPHSGGIWVAPDTGLTSPAASPDNTVVAPTRWVRTSPGRSRSSSNGHNIFGSDVAGAIAGDRENIAASRDLRRASTPTPAAACSTPAASSRCATASPTRRSAAATRWRPAPPASSAHARPLPGRQPARHRLGRDQPGAVDPPSANNDVITGSSAGNTISGWAAPTTSRAWAATTRCTAAAAATCSTAGRATTSSTATPASTSSSTAAATKVTVDLSLATDKANARQRDRHADQHRGGDRLQRRRHLQGRRRSPTGSRAGCGKDTATGGGGRDLYDFNAVADSRPAAPTAT